MSIKVQIEQVEITQNDILYICFMVEKIARLIHQKNKYIVNQIGEKELGRLLFLTDVFHCENSDKIAEEWIKKYQLKSGQTDVTRVNKELVDRIPTEMDMAHVYQRLIMKVHDAEESYAKTILDVYNAPITEIIDNYNTAAYYTPNYLLQQAYYANSFNGIN